jgi:dCMP deaminase
VSIKGATLYSTHFPCVLCTKLLINAGIRRVVYMSGYPDDLAQQLIAEAGLEVCHIEDPPDGSPSQDRAVKSEPERQQ